MLLSLKTYIIIILYYHFQSGENVSSAVDVQNVLENFSIEIPNNLDQVKNVL